MMYKTIRQTCIYYVVSKQCECYSTWFPVSTNYCWCWYDILPDTLRSDTWSTKSENSSSSTEAAPEITYVMIKVIVTYIYW